MPSPAEILHGRNLMTRAQAEIDIKAICSVLQERQLKMTLDHDTSRRAKKARPFSQACVKNSVHGGGHV